MKFCLQVNAVCDVGLKKPNNEDMILINKEIFRDGKRQTELDPEKRLVLAVADGIGGLDKGEVASEKALTEMRERLSKIPDDLNEDELREVFNIFASETNASMSSDIGTTIAGLFLYQGKVFRYHAGDSRIYRMRRGELTRLTVDHSLRESGGRPDAPSNIITNALGGGQTAFIEFAEIEYPLFVNDIYIISSDGMHDLVSSDEITAALKQSKPAEKLVKLAKEKGGKDNISVIIIIVKGK